MMAARRQHARNVIFRYRGAHDLNLGREQLACRSPRRYRQHDRFDFNRSQSFGGIDGAADRILRLHQIDDRAGFGPTRQRMAEADYLNGMAAPRQNLLRTMRTKPADQAD